MLSKLFNRLAPAFVALALCSSFALGVNLTGTNTASQDMILKAGFLRMSVTDGITAFAGGGQTNATPLVSAFNRISTVGSGGDSVLLPPCVTGVAGATIGYGNTDGMLVAVVNSSATSANVFPQSGQKINGGSADAQIALAGSKSALFICSTNGSWYTVPFVPS